MFKSILVQLTGTETDEVALATALQAGRLFGSHLECLRVGMDSGVMVGMAAGVAMAPAGAVAEAFKELKKQDAEFAAQARLTFDQFCKRESIPLKETAERGDWVTACLRECVGDQAKEIIKRGRFNDLLVLSRKSKALFGLTPSELGLIVLNCGRPVIVNGPSPPKRLDGRIAIAWKDTAEAARVVAASMPILSRAAQVVILTANEENDGALNCIECAERMAESVRWHNCAVEVEYLVPGGRKIAETIVDAAHKANADMLIAGAYGHSRLRELVFGGFTQQILERASLPVLLFH